MKRILLTLSVPALLIAGVAGASARDAGVDAKVAAGVAAKATKALGKGNAAAAVPLAEQAVALSPREASYRALLGRSYLQAGRFASARATLEEAVRLDGGHGGAALSLVLAQIATGDWATARATLDAKAEVIPAADRGLALALAGDPAAAVALLTQAARQPGATAKTRQNLALSLALAGQWGMAKAVAAADMPPGQVDARMVEWAAFAQPRSASDQVASLLGVSTTVDAGRPTTIALDAPVAQVAAADVAVAPPPVVATLPSIAPERAAAFAGVTFGPAREVSQPLPLVAARPVRSSSVPLIRAQAGPNKVAFTRAAAPAISARPVKGDWYVQIGAFDSAGVARDAWGRATRRFAAFKGRMPTGMNFAHGKGSFYRLSVGGFTRADAVGLCGRYRAVGGSCFVRIGAGDQMAQWLRTPGQRKPAVQLAMR
jgi:Flp pilus assembly protein TadD